METMHPKVQHPVLRKRLSLLAGAIGVLFALSACGDSADKNGSGDTDVSAINTQNSKPIVDNDLSDRITISADQYVSAETFGQLNEDILETAQACNNGFAEACGIIGERLFSGVDVKKNSNEGVRLLKIACDAGDIKGACGNLGVAYAVGKGVDQDYKKAATLFSKSCDAGSKIACDNLQKIKPQYRNIREEFAKKANDPEMAKTFCEYSKSGPHCMLLGALHKKGEGVEQSDTMATKYFGLACDANYAAGCYTLGFRYYKGEGVEKNPSEAVKAWKKACDAGHKKSCEIMDKIYASTKDN